MYYSNRYGRWFMSNIKSYKKARWKKAYMRQMIREGHRWTRRNVFHRFGYSVLADLNDLPAQLKNYIRKHPITDF